MDETTKKPLVLVQADYYAECGIWLPGGCVADPMERLGISPELDTQMRQWIASYYAMQDDAPFPYEEFGRRGRKLAQELKRQLGDSYEVQYFDEAKNRDLPEGADSIWDIID